jgi:hypothetical protein
MEDFVRTEVDKAEDNKPLLIEADDGFGKKALLVNWMNYHAKREAATQVVRHYQKYKDVVVPHFASVGGNSQNYFYTIYKILVKLRDIFNIKYKVELLEEKIRKYFPFWLDLFQSKIE